VQGQEISSAFRCHALAPLESAWLY
jgi:hypothetical protein